LSKEVFSTDDLLEILRLTYQEKRSSRYIGQIYGVGKSTIGNFLRKETYKDFWESQEDKPLVAGEVACPTTKRKILKGKKFVFTSAQNNTYVHDKFLKSLLHYCETENAELIVGTFHYNKSGFQNGNSEEVWFDPKIREYILDESGIVAESLLWCGELNILPTAVNPMSGLHNYTNKDSAIVPHAKLQMESFPTPKDEPAKLMYTTGCVTQRNYVEMKAGQKASHHHVFGALVVEIDEEGDWFVRQLCAESETGKFFDLGWYYTPEGKEQEPYCVEAINWGDIHAAKLDETVAQASWGKGEDSMVNTLMPEHLFLHDVYDHKSRNHHNIKDPYFMFQMFNEKTESVKVEVEKTAEVITDMLEVCGKVVIVESNHDLALERWLKEQDYKKDPVNAVFFLEMQLENYYAMSRGDKLKTFQTACHKVEPFTKEALFLSTDESYMICGNIECGSHGHNGNNGARGSVRAFQMQGGKFNTGHTHSASIKDGVYTAGVSGKLDQGYNVGGSSWTQSHIVTYSNGKRTIITLKNGKWKA